MMSDTIKIAPGLEIQHYPSGSVDLILDGNGFTLTADELNALAEHAPAVVELCRRIKQLEQTMDLLIAEEL